MRDEIALQILRHDWQIYISNKNFIGFNYGRCYVGTGRAAGGRPGGWVMPHLHINLPLDPTFVHPIRFSDQKGSAHEYLADRQTDG